jgi:hypothetical protein
MSAVARTPAARIAQRKDVLMKTAGAIVLWALVFSACGGGTSETSTATGQRASSASVAATAKAASPAAIVDTCGLFTQGEVEAMLRRSVLAGEKDQAATLATCSYGNPATPVVNGKPTDVLLVLSVLTDELPNQSKGIFEIAKSNAAEVQMVSGLGEQAFWDNVGRVLRVVKGNHLVEASLGSDLGGLDTARAIMEKMLAKLS